MPNQRTKKNSFSTEGGDLGVEGLKFNWLVESPMGQRTYHYHVPSIWCRNYSPSSFKQAGGARCEGVVLFKEGQLYSEVRVLCGKVAMDGREQLWGDIDAKNEWGTLVTYLEGQRS